MFRIARLGFPFLAMSVVVPAFPQSAIAPAAHVSSSVATDHQKAEVQSVPYQTVSHPSMDAASDVTADAVGVASQHSPAPIGNMPIEPPTGPADAPLKKPY